MWGLRGFYTFEDSEIIFLILTQPKKRKCIIVLCFFTYIHCLIYYEKVWNTELYFVHSFCIAFKDIPETAEGLFMNSYIKKNE